MAESIYLVGNRLNGLMDNLQIIATNLSNANTPGYKRTVGAFRAVLDGFAADPADPSVPVGLSGSWSELSGHYTDLTQGPIQVTDRDLDVAIRGPAFLVVETPVGPRYTRRGRLYADSEGNLTDASGNPFGSDSGALAIPGDTGRLTITPDGTVLADGTAIGTLSLVDIPEPDKLVAEGSSTFRNDGAAAEPAADSEVIQGSIEQSNVEALRETITLVTVMRAYEAGARIIKRLDGLDGQLIKST